MPPSIPIILQPIIFISASAKKVARRAIFIQKMALSIRNIELLFEKMALSKEI